VHCETCDVSAVVARVTLPVNRQLAIHGAPTDMEKVALPEA